MAVNDVFVSVGLAGQIYMKVWGRQKSEYLHLDGLHEVAALKARLKHQGGVIGWLELDGPGQRAIPVPSYPRPQELEKERKRW